MALHYNTVNALLQELSVMQRRLEDIKEKTVRDLPLMDGTIDQAKRSLQEIKNVLLGEG